MKYRFAVTAMRASLVALSLISLGKSAHAAPVPPPPIASTPCDTLYYESLSARAWLEAQREITQNQNIILKPDSVLEYTCFNLFLGELATHASNMLSETNQFGGPMSSTSMDNALQDLVVVSFRAYMKGNFGHIDIASRFYDLLGGHSAGSGINHNIRDIGDFGTMSYNCEIMQKVWQAAKCINFSSHLTINPNGGGTPTDGFFTFQEYADITATANQLDRRHRPTMCYSPVTNPAGYAAMKAQWNTNLVAAYITPPWTEDPVRTYLANIAAPTCTGSPCQCQINSTNSVPIPTGVSVTRSNAIPPTYEDKICAQPGCRYNPPGGIIDGSVRAEGCWAR